MIDILMCFMFFLFFFFKQKTAYEMRISDWSSDVCSSDLDTRILALMFEAPTHRCFSHEILKGDESWINELPRSQARSSRQYAKFCWTSASRKPNTARVSTISPRSHRRSEEHTSELQSLMRISYAVFCLKTKIKRQQN